MRPVRLISIAFAVCALVSAGRGEWTRVETGSLAWLYAVHFADADYGWAGGSSGTLLSTTDGGLEWKKERFLTKDTIRDIYFADRFNGWLLCERYPYRAGGADNVTYLMRTTDGGKKWSQVELKNSPERFVRFFFKSSTEGYLIGEGGTMVGVPQGDEAEQRTSLPLRFLMLAGSSPDGLRVVLVGGGGSILFTGDDGSGWQTPRFAGDSPRTRLNTVYFFDRLHGWAAGNGGSIFSSSDGGRSWENRQSNTSANILDLRFYDRKNGFAVGESGVILRSHDSGMTWALDKNPSKHRLERIAFSGRSAFAVGFGGTMISTALAAPE